MMLPTRRGGGAVAVVPNAVLSRRDAAAPMRTTRVLGDRVLSSVICKVIKKHL